MHNEWEEGLEFILLEDHEDLEEQELNLDARLIVEVLQDFSVSLGLSFADLLMDSSLFLISFLRISDCSKVSLRLEFYLIKVVSKLELFLIQWGGDRGFTEFVAGESVMKEIFVLGEDSNSWLEEGFRLCVDAGKDATFPSSFVRWHPKAMYKSKTSECWFADDL